MLSLSLSLFFFFSAKGKPSKTAVHSFFFICVCVMSVYMVSFLFSVEKETRLVSYRMRASHAFCSFLTPCSFLSPFLWL